MIGLQRPGQVRLNEDEPIEIRQYNKQQLYFALCQQYLLPPIESKGVNRAYLVGVYTHQHFRVALIEYKRFEAELTPAQLKKTGLVNLMYILRKLNALLVEKGERTLGFPGFIIPEEAWLCKVARFVDRKNVMEFFQVSLQDIQPLEINSDRVHHGRVLAHRYIFANNHLLDNPKVFQTVKDISDSYRKIISKRIDLEEANHARQQLVNRINEEEALLKSLLVRASTTIIGVANDQFDPEAIYIEDNDNGNIQAQRIQLGEMTRL